MYDRKSIYALNKRDPDANGNLLRLTQEDFADTETFLCWKAWSDENFRAENKSDIAESDHTVSMDGIPEAALVEERRAREEQICRAEEAVSRVNGILTKVQFHRLWKYCAEGKTEDEIAEAAGISQQAVSKSLVAALKKSKNFLESASKVVMKTPEKR